MKRVWCARGGSRGGYRGRLSLAPSRGRAGTSSTLLRSPPPPSPAPASASGVVDAPKLAPTPIAPKLSTATSGSGREHPTKLPPAPIPTPKLAPEAPTPTPKFPPEAPTPTPKLAPTPTPTPTAPTPMLAPKLPPEAPTPTPKLAPTPTPTPALTPAPMLAPAPPPARRPCLASVAAVLARLPRPSSRLRR
ncbi:hypothetical protein Pmani_010481 [Petrolisthes manimaculis]|uniref:Uncharacterized protein n=1 Tax=Petrolisthes manimaculis TaxID=1843537 RepID=A0AAE1Q1E0_9EUCA|nr:hypothetical protein Pmani_010481 [Petrolisthes manimaculis]